MTSNNASSTYQVNSSASNQNLTLAQNGAQDASVIIQSAGTNATNTAVQIKSANAAGNIAITNNTTGTGSITNYSGSGGYSVTTNTGGAINLTANAASSTCVVNSTGGSGQTLTLSVSGAPLANNSLVLQSNGTNQTSAILIQNTNTAGGVQITNGAGSSGAIQLDSGSGGITGLTQTGGGINLTAFGAVSTFINNNASDPAIKSLITDVETCEKKPLKVQLTSTDFAKFSVCMADILNDEVKNENFCKLLKPEYSTTKWLCSAVSSMLLMNTLKEYFTYEFICECGIPSIILDGTQEVWLLLQKKYL